MHIFCHKSHPIFSFYFIADSGSCHNLLVKSTAEKVIVVEISALTAKNKSRTDLVEAKLQYEPLLSITRGEETAKSNMPSFFAHTVYLIAIRFIIKLLYTTVIFLFF